MSADDLRINLWNLEITNQSFNIVDIKPTNMEDLTEVITAAEFDPSVRCAPLCSRHFLSLLSCLPHPYHPSCLGVEWKQMEIRIVAFTKKPIGVILSSPLAELFDVRVQLE